jgi:hypothetical protein
LFRNLQMLPSNLQQMAVARKMWDQPPELQSQLFEEIALFHSQIHRQIPGLFPRMEPTFKYLL